MKESARNAAHDSSLRVVFLMTDYALHNALVTDYLAARPQDEVSLVKIPLVLKGKGRRGTAERIVPQLSRRFLGGKIFEFVSLAMITAIPKILARGAVFRRLRRTASLSGLEFHKTGNVMSEGTLAFLRAREPDLIISLCHQILKEPLISLPRSGIINLHPGVLPEFKGIQPYFWELSEGSALAGATLHWIEDEGIDTGRILARTTFSIPERCSVQLNYYLTIRAASQLLPECVARVVRGELHGTPQGAEDGQYYRWPDSEAFDRLRARGHSLISFRQLFAILTGRYDDLSADVEWGLPAESAVPLSNQQDE